MHLNPHAAYFGAPLAQIVEVGLEKRIPVCAMAEDRGLGPHLRGHIACV
jgi:hypothetical protein